MYTIQQSTGERETLDYYLNKDDFERVGELSFIKLILRSNPVLDEKNMKFCTWFILGENWKYYFKGEEFSYPNYFPKTGIPQRNDIIVYYDEFGEFSHIGKINKNKKVVSKFGSGFVYEHEIWHVPTSYGNKYKLFLYLNE